MENQEFKIEGSAFVTDEEKISNMLGALKRVEAPGDFDFRVKARIAAGRPADNTASWLPASVRYAVPLALLLFVGAYFAFNAVYPTSNIDVPVVAEVPPERIAPVSDPGSSDAMPPPSNETIAERVDVKPAETENKKVSSPSPKADRPGGGSYDSAGTSTINLTPKGAVPNTNASQDPKPPVGRSPMSAREFLTSIGINASFAGPSGKVHSVSGAAASAGVKAGDVIESVDPHTGGILIRRDGKTIQFRIKPFAL